MDRRTIDKLLSSTGAVLGVVLLLGGILLTWAGSFASGQVSSQLKAQGIVMPTEEAFVKQSAEDQAALRPFAGQPMTNGNQAKAFADHYILAHMNASSDGRTYEEVSSEFMALSAEEKAADEGQALGALRQSLFMGNTLRSILLTAYAFGMIGTLATIGSIVAYSAGVVLLVLAFFGFRRTKAVAPAVTTPIVA